MDEWPDAQLCGAFQCTLFNQPTPANSGPSRYPGKSMGPDVSSTRQLAHDRKLPERFPLTLPGRIQRTKVKQTLFERPHVDFWPDQPVITDNVLPRIVPRKKILAQQGVGVVKQITSIDAGGSDFQLAVQPQSWVSVDHTSPPG